jgi:hypothetical protein
MKYKNLEEDIIFKYWETLILKNISNIQTNKFIKKPYLESYIIDLSVNLNDEVLKKYIIKNIEKNIISKEDIILFINNNFEFNNEDKKNIQLSILKNLLNKNDYQKILINVIIYSIKYFRFYQTITELLFDFVSSENELYNFIYVYIKNNKNYNTKYIKKNLKFKIFYFYIDELFILYNDVFDIFKKLNMINDKYDKSEIRNLFLKNLFINWYNIYKKDILENKVNDKIKDYEIPSSFFSKILCLPSL